jgi:hypothetical protein
MNHPFDVSRPREDRNDPGQGLRRVSIALRPWKPQPESSDGGKATECWLFPFLKKLCATLRPEIRKTQGNSHCNKEKADVVECPEAFDHVGLLVNEPPGLAGLPFI